MTSKNKRNLAYIIGVAIGDGNLSNPNGRATRLRITCDTKYPELINKIIKTIKIILPHNRVSIIKRAKTYWDISCYSNAWEKWLGWKAKNGPKYKQPIKIHAWIKRNKTYAINCLRGLIQTDGSIYHDRGYQMINLVTVIPQVANDASAMIQKLNFSANTYAIAGKGLTRYNLRISKKTKNFIKLLSLKKS